MFWVLNQKKPLTVLEKINILISKIYFFINLKNRKFDFIILDNVFEHFDDPSNVLKKLYELLNNDGKIYVYT